jgi:hypothetical protein
MPTIREVVTEQAGGGTQERVKLTDLYDAVGEMVASRTPLPRITEFLGESGWKMDEYKAAVKGAKERAGRGIDPTGISQGIEQGVVNAFGFNAMDEVSAYGAAPIRALRRGESLSTAKDRGLEERRLAAKLMPKAAQVVGEVGGSIVNPVLSAAGGPLATAGRSAVSAALSGFGSGEGMKDRLTKAGTSAAIAAPLGAGAGYLTNRAAQSGGVTLGPQAPATVAAADRLGIEPTLGMVGSKPVQMLEQAGAQFAPSAGPIIARNRLAAEQAETAVANTARLISPTRAGVETPQQAGILARGTAERTGQARPGAPAPPAGFSATRAGRRGQNFDAEINDRLDRVAGLVGGQAYDVTPLTTLRQQLVAEMGQAPESRTATYRPVIERIDRYLQDAQTTGGLSWETARGLRTELGQELETPDVTGYVQRGSPQLLRRVYGEMRRGLMNTAQQAGGDAAAEARRTDRFIRFFRSPHRGAEAPAEVLNKIVDRGDDVRAWTYLRGDARRFRTFRRAVSRYDPQAYDAVAASLWNTLGRGKPGAVNEAGDFSWSTFLTNFNELNEKGTLNAAFSGTRYEPAMQAMRDLSTIAGDMRNVQKLANHSNTAGVMQNIGLVLGAVNAPWATASAVVGAGGSSLLFTRPGFVRWLTGNLRNAVNRPQSFSPNNFTADLSRRAAEEWQKIQEEGE